MQNYNKKWDNNLGPVYGIYINAKTKKNCFLLL